MCGSQVQTAALSKSTRGSSLHLHRKVWWSCFGLLFYSKTLYPIDEGAASVEQSIKKTVPLSVTDDKRFKKDTMIMSVSYFTSSTRYERMTERTRVRWRLRGNVQESGNNFTDALVSSYSVFFLRKLWDVSENQSLWRWGWFQGGGQDDQAQELRSTTNNNKSSWN